MIEDNEHPEHPEHPDRGAYDSDTAYPGRGTVATARTGSRARGIPAVAYGAVFSQEEILHGSDRMGLDPLDFSEYQELNAGLWDVPTYYIDCEALMSLMAGKGHRLVVEPVPGGMYAAGLPMEDMPGTMVLDDYGQKVLGALSEALQFHEPKELVFFPYEESLVPQAEREDGEGNEEDEEEAGA